MENSRIREMASVAEKASIMLAAINTGLKNNALNSIAEALINNKNDIIKANQADLERSQKENISAPLLKKTEV